MHGWSAQGSSSKFKRNQIREWIHQLIAYLNLCQSSDLASEILSPVFMIPSGEGKVQGQGVGVGVGTTFKIELYHELCGNRQLEVRRA